MCSRYTLSAGEKKIRQAYPYTINGAYKPNYNLAPTQLGLVITADKPTKIQPMHFGLVPFWAKDTKLNISTLNARSEEVLEKKTYAPLISHHKTCLVVADGFIEWDKKTGQSLPWHFKLKDRKLFAFAGLWSQWKSGEIVYRSFTILTTQSNEIVGKVHDPKFRMPVILNQEDEKIWLDKTISPNDLVSLCKTFPDELMTANRLSTEINATVVKGTINNRPELILPLNSN